MASITPEKQSSTKSSVLKSDRAHQEKQQSLDTEVLTHLYLKEGLNSCSYTTAETSL